MEARLHLLSERRGAHASVHPRIERILYYELFIHSPQLLFVTKVRKIYHLLAKNASPLPQHSYADFGSNSHTRFASLKSFSVTALPASWVVVSMRIKLYPNVMFG